MKKIKLSYISICLYLFANIYLLMHVMPFVFTGFYGDHEDPLIAKQNVCIVDLSDGRDLPPIANAAIWFSENKMLRNTLTIISIVFLLLTQILINNERKKYIIIQLFLWGSLLLLCIYLMGMVEILN